jgi:hypothetical protein
MCRFSNHPEQKDSSSGDGQVWSNRCCKFCGADNAGRRLTSLVQNPGLGKFAVIPGPHRAVICSMAGHASSIFG